MGIDTGIPADGRTRQRRQLGVDMVLPVCCLFVSFGGRDESLLLHRGVCRRPNRQWLPARSCSKFETIDHQIKSDPREVGEHGPCQAETWGRWLQAFNPTTQMSTIPLNDINIATWQLLMKKISGWFVL
jgi:hypothetical protein